MSFILEALRRAEAQRQRGGVPGLHAQPAAAALADLALAHQIRARRPWRLVFALAAVLLLLAAAARWWLGPAGLAPTLSAAQPLSVAPAARVSSPAPAAEPALASSLRVSVTSASVASATAANASRQTSPVAASAGLPLIAAPLPLKASAPAPALAPISLSASASALPSAPPSALSSPSRWPTLAELPETLRRELPVLALGGSVYAEQASQRMVIINGQVLREGDRLAPELLLQQIRLKSVLLDYRGQRFELPF
jgi:general secretion pathway protein B